MTKKTIMVKVPKSVFVGFKLACVRNEKTMTEVVEKFMENYALAVMDDFVMEEEALEDG